VIDSMVKVMERSLPRDNQGENPATIWMRIRRGE
jgi:hypothetical protein